MKKLISLILTLMLLCGTALADNGTVITMDTSNVPAIPEGTLSAEVISFTGNQTYAVYSAPNKKSIRGAKGRARVSTNGWIQVFGAEDDWILVQYDISDKQNRIGYIYINALPRDVTVPDLNLKRAAAVVNYDVEVTDDPLVSKTPLAKLTENTKVTCLGTMGTWTYIEGKEISEFNDKQLSHVISVVLTEKPDIRNMTVEELVGLGRSPYTGFWGTLTQEDKKVVNHSIHLVGIDELQDRMIQTLSDGERQKVMIAKALAQETPVIYLDEPTAFLDYPSKVEMMQLLFKLSRETDKTIFLSTHDLELALQIADKLWLMDKQKGVRIGAPEDLSLDGSLGSFFARKGIVFDPEIGLFRVENDYTRQIRVQGEGVRMMMVFKALKRIGIQGNVKAESEDVIEVFPDRYLLRHLGNITECLSIADLLNELK